jgi:hypothetical protein
MLTLILIRTMHGYCFCVADEEKKTRLRKIDILVDPKSGLM